MFPVCVCLSILRWSVCVLCSSKIEKEKKEHARQHGMIRTEISGAEIAEEMEKERRFFQLQMCEVRGGSRFDGESCYVALIPQELPVHRV